MSPSELAARLVTLDWSATSLKHQLAICAVLETLLTLEKETPMHAPAAANSNVLPFPRPTHRWVRLLHLDGREWCSAGFCEPGGAWEWIVETVVAEMGCSEDDVACAEDPEGGGDLVTIDGLWTYRIAHGHPRVQN